VDSRKSSITRRKVLVASGSALLMTLLGDEVAFGSKKKSAQKRAKRGRSSKKKQKPSRSTSTPRAAAGPISGEGLFRDVITYYNLGEHRTATEGDLKTADWLAKELRNAGVPATFQPFAVEQFFPREISLRIAGVSVRAFPLWPPRPTEQSPLRRPLVSFSRQTGPRSLHGAIALVRFPADPRAAISKESGQTEIINAAARSGASAVVAITEGPSGEIVALNIERGRRSWPLPVVLVGPRDQALLTECEKGELEASLVLEGKQVEAVARNVVAKRSRGDKFFVVSTPQSGWFRCAAERGPGVALFLGLARWAAKRNTNSSFLFVSTSGHELGALGMQAFLKELAPAPEQVKCWLHLGAGIASFAWEDLSNGPHRLREAEARRYLMTTPDFVPILKDTFTGLPGMTLVTGRAVGELEALITRRYRAFGIAAGHRFHHTPADSPEMTGPEILEPVASALIRTIETIDQA
jgi:hypothetical protein